MKKCVLFFLALAACSSEPTVQDPAWIKQPTRIVDNGYIVYVGATEDVSSERAQFKAEGLALEDLANECAFIPKGTRIEDRYVKQEKHVYQAFVKIGLEFTECDQARQTLDPAKIKELGNVAFTEQLKKYQDLVETGEMTKGSEFAQVQPDTDGAGAPARGTMTDTTHFYVVRQYIAYQNQVVILSPPTAYAPNSPETQHFTMVMRPAVEQVNTYQAANPALQKSPQPWSQVPNKPPIARPTNLASSRAAPMMNRGFQQAKSPNGRPMSSRGASPAPGSGMPKKKRRWHSRDH